VRVLASIVEWDKVLDVIVNSSVAGIGVTAAYAICVFGTTRVIDMTKAGRIPEAALYGALATVMLVVTLASAVFGVIVMTTK